MISNANSYERFQPIRAPGSVGIRTGCVNRLEIEGSVPFQVVQLNGDEGLDFRESGNLYPLVEKTVSAEASGFPRLPGMTNQLWKGSY